MQLLSGNCRLFYSAQIRYYSHICLSNPLTQLYLWTDNCISGDFYSNLTCLIILIKAIQIQLENYPSKHLSKKMSLSFDTNFFRVFSEWRSEFNFYSQDDREYTVTKNIKLLYIQHTYYVTTTYSVSEYRYSKLRIKETFIISFEIPQLKKLFPLTDYRIAYR